MFRIIIKESFVEISSKDSSYPESYIRLNTREDNKFDIIFVERGSETILEDGKNRDEAFLLTYFYALNRFCFIDLNKEVSNRLLRQTSFLSDIFSILKESLASDVYDSINSKFGMSIEESEYLGRYNVYIYCCEDKIYIRKNMNLNIAGSVLYNYSLKIQEFNKRSQEIELSKNDELYPVVRKCYMLGRSDVSDVLLRI